MSFSCASSICIILFSSLIAGCGQSAKSPGSSSGGARTSDQTRNRPTATVTLFRTPNGGIQPQAAIDKDGRVHLIYFKGKPIAGNLFYVSKGAEEATFSAPIRVNSKTDSVIAMGNVRGAHLALGRKRRVHVAWMGSQKTRAKETKNKAPMLYTRLNDKGEAFEVERNVISKAYRLDGGGSLAADNKGNVYVVWHAPTPEKRGEEHRRVWVAHSNDEGKTFAPERSAFQKQIGACGCCGMRAWVDREGLLYVLFRSATKQVNRDIYLLRSKNFAESFISEKLDTWSIASCPMSTMGFGESHDEVLAAWETRGQVLFARIDSKTDRVSKATTAPGPGSNRKHPVIAHSTRGEILLAWTEGMGWNRGGSLAWQIYDNNGDPKGKVTRMKGVPVWSVITGVALPNGDFILIW